MFSFRAAAFIRSVIIAFLLFIPSFALAQSASVISGTVKDSSGGVLPGVSVKITNETTNTSADIVTNPDGTYTSEPLTPGPYRVSVSLDGFETVDKRIVVAAGQPATNDVTLSPARFSQSVVVTARRVEEQAQDVPIPVSVVRGDLVSDAGAFNVNRLKEMIPTVQFYSSNPRNSAINIRGLGAPFGLTNDGLEPGVGLYIDGVFYARPASATLDFLDVDQVEVLRGPQGTLFGKNTTAGAINVTTRKPSFTPGTELEVNYGNLQFVQAKASVTGPLGGKWAGRVSFSGTQRDGTHLQREVAAGHERAEQRRACAASSSSRRRTSSRSRSPSTTRVSGPTATRRWSPASRRPSARPNRQWAAIVVGSALHAAELQRVRPADGHRLAAAVQPGSRRRVAQRRLEAGARPPDVHDVVALLGLGSVERPRLHRPAGHHDFGRHLEAAPVGAGSAVRGGRVPQAELRRRRVRVQPAHPVGSRDQTGTGISRLPVPARAERGRVDAWPAGRLRLQPVPRLQQPERRAVRPAAVVDHRPPAAAARPAAELRQEGRRFRPAGVRRTADDQPGADRAEAVGPGAAGVHGERGRHEHVGADHRGVQGHREGQSVRHVRDGLQVRRPQPERAPHRRAGTAHPLDGDGQARGRPQLRGRPEDDAASATSRRTWPSSTPRSRTTRHR